MATNDLINLSGAIAELGEQGTFTFVANAGDRIFLDRIDANNSVFLSLVSPSGITISSSIFSDSSVFTLTETGTYRVIVDGSGSGTGNYNYDLLKLNLAPELSLGGTNPIADSVVRFSSSGTTNSLVQIDADGLSPARAINLIRVLNVGVSDLSNPNNFEF
jgi:hypothetical protein